MKPSRSYFFIAISSISLVAVLAIQVNWILDTAHIKEQLFNEKANMVLSRTVEDVQADQQTCQQLGQCIGKTEIQTIDSLLAKNMAFYNFYMDYSFELLQPDKTIPAEEPDLNSNVFKKRLDEVVSQNGLELKLVFSTKRTIHSGRNRTAVFQLGLLDCCGTDSLLAHHFILTETENDFRTYN